MNQREAGEYLRDVKARRKFYELLWYYSRKDSEENWPAPMNMSDDEVKKRIHQYLGISNNNSAVAICWLLLSLVLILSVALLVIIA